MIDQLAVLKAPFDPETHKATFIHYFEAVMTRDGTVVYACPGHIEVLERLYVAAKHAEPTLDAYREWLKSSDMWLSYDAWLMESTGAICLWTFGYTGVPNDTQLSMIEELRRQGILEG